MQCAIMHEDMDGEEQSPGSERGGSESRSWASRLSGIVRSRTVRRRAFWTVILLGGGLQYAYTTTNRPATVLVVWAWIFRVWLGVTLVALIVAGAIVVHGRFGRHREGRDG
jgi:hypothetical protein